MTYTPAVYVPYDPGAPGGPTGDVLEYDTVAQFPAVGKRGRLYVALQPSPPQTFVWSDGAYVTTAGGDSGGGGPATTWANIPGRPTVVAAGADKAAARASIDALDSTAAQSLIAAEVNDLLDGAPEKLNSFRELADALDDDEDFAATVNAALAARLTPAAADARYASLGAQIDVPIGLGWLAALGPGWNTAQATTGTSLVYVPITVPGRGIRLKFANHTINSSGGVVVPTTDLTIGGVSVADAAGTLHRLTFNGSRSITLAGGAEAWTDPIDIDVTAQTWLAVRTFIPSGQSWYANKFAYGTGVGSWVATSDLTAPGSAAMADSAFAFLYGPIAVVGTPTSRVPVVGGWGDSVMEGWSDGIKNNHTRNKTSEVMGGGGWLGRCAWDHGFGVINMGIQGGTVRDWFAVGHMRQSVNTRVVSTLLCNYGTNDISVGRTLAQLQANNIALWIDGAQRTKRVFQTNVLPHTTSTDGFVTLANQVVTAQESVRLAWNAWLRDGAPMVAGAAVAVGTVGASRCRYYQNGVVSVPASGPSHPLYGVIEIADAVESARDSGKWAVSGLGMSRRTVTDGATVSATTITSATANFTAADVGKVVYGPTLGTGNTPYVGSIYNYAGSVSITDTVVNGLTGQTLTIGDFPTIEGLHPQRSGAIAIAAVIPYQDFV